MKLTVVVLVIIGLTFAANVCDPPCHVPILHYYFIHQFRILEPANQETLAYVALRQDGLVIVVRHLYVMPLVLDAVLEIALPLKFA